MTDPSAQEIIILLREIAELHRRELAVREAYFKMIEDNGKRTLADSKEQLAEITKEGDQRRKEEQEFRAHILKELANHTELLSQILTKITN